MPTKKSKHKVIEEKNIIVEMYKLKFEALKPISQSLADLQIRKQIRPDTTYAQGFSDGFDMAVDSLQKVMTPFEVNNHNNGKK